MRVSVRMSSLFEHEIQHHMDASGLFCPEPVMLLHNKVREMTTGDILEVIATDPSTERDIPKFCHFLGYELVAAKQKDDSYHYLIRKKC